MRATVQQSNIVAINLALLIIPKAGAQTFDVKPSRVVNVSRRGTGRGESGSEKRFSPYKTYCHEQEKGAGPRAPFIVRRQIPPGIGRPRASRHSPDLFTHSSECPASEESSPSIWHRAQSRTPGRRPTCPSSFHHCQPPPLPPRKILFLLPQRACPDTPPMRITELIRMRYIIVSVFRNVEWSWRLYKFLTCITRWSVKAGEAITGIEIIAPATVVRWRYYILQVVIFFFEK